MIFLCADDYGLSEKCNSRIENCLKNGALNKISVLPNGEVADFKRRTSECDVTLSLHVNLVEGKPLSDPADVDILVGEDGYFKYSFVGLFFLSFSPKRKKFEKQLYKEIKSQITFWENAVGEDTELSIDSHQHTHMIPIVFKTLMRVIADEGLKVANVRIPAEPIMPYLMTPSLYFDYSPTGIIKQWILKVLALFNSKQLKKSKIPSAYFMGVMFSGRLNEKKIKKLLPKYLKLAEKNDKNIEIAFHPGYLENGEKPMQGSRKSFDKFYFSHWRNDEYDTLMNLKF